MTTRDASVIPLVHRVRSLSYMALVVGIAALAGAPSLQATVQHLAQSRTITTFATVSIPEDFAHDAQTVAAPDFGPFDDALEMSVALPSISAMATAFQRSTLGDDSFVFDGDFHAEAANAVEGGFAEAFGQSLFNYDFAVDAPAGFTLIGELIATGQGASHLAFSSSADGLIFIHGNSGQGTFPVYLSHQLSPGVLYRIATNTNGFGQAFGSIMTVADGTIHLEGTFSAIVTVPGTGDVAAGRAYPNPTRGPATFELAGDDGATASILLYDASGRLVRSLAAVNGRARWDGLTATGQAAAPGVYFYRTGPTAESPGRRLVVTD